MVIKSICLPRSSNHRMQGEGRGGVIKAVAVVVSSLDSPVFRCRVHGGSVHWCVFPLECHSEWLMLFPNCWCGERGSFVVALHSRRTEQDWPSDWLLLRLVTALLPASLLLPRLQRPSMREWHIPFRPSQPLLCLPPAPLGATRAAAEGRGPPVQRPQMRPAAAASSTSSGAGGVRHGAPTRRWRRPIPPTGCGGAPQTWGPPRLGP